MCKIDDKLKNEKNGNYTVEKNWEKNLAIFKSHDIICYINVNNLFLSLTVFYRKCKKVRRLL